MASSTDPERPSPALVEHSRALLAAREHYPGYGMPYLLSRALLFLGIVILLVMFSDANVRIGGAVGIGFLVGMVYKEVTVIERGRKRWSLQLQLYDWPKIEAIAEQESPDAQS